jgi:hypothetical protein
VELVDPVVPVGVPAAVVLVAAPPRSISSIDAVSRAMAALSTLATDAVGCVVDAPCGRCDSVLLGALDVPCALDDVLDVPDVPAVPVIVAEEPEVPAVPVGAAAVPDVPVASGVSWLVVAGREADDAAVPVGLVADPVFVIAPVIPLFGFALAASSSPRPLCAIAVEWN